MIAAASGPEASFTTAIPVFCLLMLAVVWGLWPVDKPDDNWVPDDWDGIDDESPDAIGTWTAYALAAGVAADQVYRMAGLVDAQDRLADATIAAYLLRAAETRINEP